MACKVVVTGIGVVSPVGNTVKTFWDNLCQGKSGIRAVEHVDLSNQRSQIAGMAEDVLPDGVEQKDLRRKSRFSLFAIEAANQAWKQAGLDINQEQPERCGTIIGSGIGGINDIFDNAIKMHTAGPRRISPLFMPMALVNMAAGNVAIHLGLQGPSQCVVTACSAGTQSIGSAADMIRLGKADVMVAGGAEATIIPFALAGFSAMKALSTRNDDPQGASRPFDKDRDGFVMGEGSGLLVLESEEHALARGANILVELAGFGESTDAYHVVAPRPDGKGGADAMYAALRQAGLNPEEVDYYNAHGTSTALNDAGESKSLRVVFGEDMPYVSSTKSMTGHLLGAAGAIEAVASVQTILSGVIHPNINYETPDPECDVNLVANEAREQKVAIAMSNSLGFGGHNASIIFKAYE